MTNKARVEPTDVRVVDLRQEAAFTSVSTVQQGMYIRLTELLVHPSGILQARTALA